VDEVLSNLTCDSDSKVSEFISRRHSLSLHELPTHATRGYYVGMFLGSSADTYHIIFG
jgi:arginine decarboxylase